MLAVSLGAQAVPALTFIDRLIDLPIGIFAVSLGSVLMSSMSRSAAQGDIEKMSQELGFSMRQVFFFCIPMAAGVMFFYNPLMSVMCLGGRYTVSDLYAAKLVALFYGAGIPLFCLLKVTGPAFYSRKDMKTPLAASCCAIVVNIVLNLILMRYLQQGGIALATVIATTVNCRILLGVLAKNRMLPKITPLVVSLGRTVLSAGVSVVLVYKIYGGSHQVETMWSRAALDLAVTAGLFGVFYLVLSAIMRSPELQELLGIFLRRKNRG
jgi:putative peptidoglycan lipid II flippase